MKFSERMQDLITKGIESSRDIASRARAQAQTWGELGVLRIEIMQLRSQAEKLVARLGAEVYHEFVEMGQAGVQADAPAVQSILANIAEIESAIGKKETRFREVGGKDADLES
jgi:hypothetical protein